MGAKHRVKVTLKAETEVFIDVEIDDSEPDGEPTDLTPEEEERAKAQAFQFAEWEIDSVEMA